MSRQAILFSLTTLASMWKMRRIAILLSLHSGSDKLSVYPLIGRHWGDRLRVKTAGTSYLEALRVLAIYGPDLFLKIYSLGCERYNTDRRSYHKHLRLLDD